ncbi:FecR domain-containing protein (plasmid) [Paroceanicella profunda]|uniref:FecR domain-containing protein n=2 Tax=Paroceanicella profunda TaxID=2579971 RepID=A0A5B8G1C8_9RHOB|nr:FecR domain-containing protein [Paroceanicella profunda]
MIGLVALAGLVLAGLVPADARAQAGPQTGAGAGCTTRLLPDPPRRGFVCPGGLVFEAEAAAALGIALPAGEAPVTQIDLERGGAYVEDGSGPHHPFQIRTPHAIASVRGTVWAVDVGEESTAVFVRSGRVAVAHVGTPSDTVLLGPGEGVDVAPGLPLEVQTWGAARVSGLMARFAR